MIRKRTWRYARKLREGVFAGMWLFLGCIRADAEPVETPLSSQIGFPPAPSASPVTSANATTDPRLLLKSLPRVQIGGPPPVSLSTQSRSDDVEQSLSEEERTAPVTFRSAAPSSENESATNSSGRRGERSGLLRRLPLVGRLVPEPKSLLRESAPEPTPTPPVLLPPPASGDPFATAPLLGVEERKAPDRNRVSHSAGLAPVDTSVGAPAASPSGLPNFYAAPTAERVTGVSEQQVSPAPAPLQRQAALESDEESRSSEVPPSGLTWQRPETSAGPTSTSATSHANELPPSMPTPRLIFPRLTSADFVAPPAELEPNDTARIEYLNALAAAREGRNAEAAAAFRSFAQRYPSSRLAPRALFLAALAARDPQEVAKAVDLLRQFFPRSDYLTELQLRGVMTATPAVSGASMAAAPQATPEAVATLRQINELREQVAADFRDRNYAAGLAKLEASPLTPQSPELLDLQSQGLIALGDHVRAVTLIEKILSEFPSYEGRSKLRLSYGLLLEDSGKYERAIAEYRRLIEEATDSVEAHTARVRIQQLNELTR